MKPQALSQFSANEKIKISNVFCGREFSRRLCDLGLFEGTKIKIVKNDGFGPLIVQIFNSQIALGRGETEKIYAKKI